MKKVIFSAVMVLLGSWVFAQEKIAVFPFEDKGNVFTGDEAVMFYRQFSNEFTNRNAGRFGVVPRQDVEKLFNTEKAFQLSKFSAEEKTAEMKRVLNGTQILSGIIARVNNGITISISLYKYPDLEQLPGGVDLSVANKSELFSKIPELVQLMQNEIDGGSGETKPAATTGKTYKVGDTGPAGGIIFYDRGFIADGWRYLEAAPTDFTAKWGAYGKDVVGTDTSVGSGKRNTQLIVDRLKQLGESNRAAQICAGMDVNGYKDWFLPSLDELDLMYKNLKQKGLGGFGGTWYWSSSQSSDNRYAWDQYFSNRNRYYDNKGNTGSVRAVRAF